MTDLPSTESNAGTGPAAPGARLAARGATIAYERHVVSRNLDVDIPAGVFTAIVGPNACGKSTLLRALGAAGPVPAFDSVEGRSVTGISFRALPRSAPP